MTRHICVLVLTTFAIATGLASAAQPEPVSHASVEIQTLVKNPPPITSPQDSVAGFKVPEKGGVLLSGKDFVAFIRIKKGRHDDERKYVFRSYSKTYRLEVSGDGYVNEHYYRISGLAKGSSSLVIDKNSNLTIDAGLFTVEWSLGDWIYIDKAKTPAREATLADYKQELRELEETKQSATAEDGDPVPESPFD